MTADFMDADRLSEAMLIILSSLSSTKNDPDDLAEIVDFLVSETQESNVDLPLLEPSSLTKATPAQRSLEELDSMPIVSILGPHLVDLLDVSPQHVPIVIDEILDHYVRGPPTALDTEDFQKAKDRLCELCERPATLTEHHLIPRSEHDLFVKRGVFTIEECRSRLALVCRPCHSAVHRAKSTRELASEYNTVEKLLEIPEIVRFAEWNAKRKVLATVVQRRMRR